MIRIVSSGFVGMENNNVIDSLVDAYFDNKLPGRSVSGLFYRFNRIVLPMINGTAEDQKKRFVKFDLATDIWLDHQTEITLEDVCDYNGYILEIAHDHDMFDGERPYYRLYLVS